MTKNAQKIYDLINTHTSHFTAEQLYERLKDSMSYATLYNNLKSLCDQGLITRVNVGGSADRYDRVERHDHLVCEKCGAIQDIDLGDLHQMIASKLNLSAFDYDVRVKYVCANCQAKEKYEA